MMRMGKKAEMGVGTLIVFIAMLLVAAIAAGVLITTVTSLQQKALNTGQESKGEISTHVQFVEISGQDGSDGSFDNFTAIGKLAAGSDPVNLNNVLVSLSLSDATSNLRYNSTADITNYANKGYFNVTYQVEGAEFREGFITRGDVITLTMIPPRNVSEDELVHITLIPQVGTQSVVEFRTPSVISRQTMTLFP